MSLDRQGKALPSSWPGPAAAPLPSCLPQAATKARDGKLGGLEKEVQQLR